MRRISILIAAAVLAIASPVLAQPGPPPSPWVFASPMIYAPAGSCVALPQTVPGGCVVGDSVNVAGGYYLNGTALVGIESVTAPLNLTSNVLSLNINASLTVDGSNNLGINLANTNIFSVTQEIPEVMAPSGSPLTLASPTGESIFFQVAGANLLALNTADVLEPITDNQVALGAVANRWTTVFAFNATISTLVTTPKVLGATGGPLLLAAPTGQSVQFAPNGGSDTVVVNTAGLLPVNDNSISLGGAGTNRWSNIYGVIATVPTIYGGTSAGSNLTLQSTLNGSPSGDSLFLDGSSVVVRPSQGGGGQASLYVGVIGASGGQIVMASNVANGMTLVNASSATGTATIPSGTYTFVGDSLTQALTNKTLTSSTDVLGGVTMTLGSDAEGDTYYRHSGLLTRLQIGINGQALYVSGGIPSWAPARSLLTAAFLVYVNGNNSPATCTPNSAVSSNTCAAGNDSTGIGTVAAPYLTLAKGLVAARSVDEAGFQITIVLAYTTPGSAGALNYGGTFALGPSIGAQGPGGNAMFITGDLNSPTSVSITAPNSGLTDGIYASDGFIGRLEYVQLDNQGTSSDGLRVGQGAIVDLLGVTCGASWTSTSGDCLWVEKGGVTNAGGSPMLTVAGCGSTILQMIGGTFNAAGIANPPVGNTIAIPSAIACSVATVVATGNAQLLGFSASTFTGSGVAGTTGTRAILAGAAYVNYSGASSINSIFPGNVNATIQDAATTNHAGDTRTVPLPVASGGIGATAAGATAVGNVSGATPISSCAGTPTSSFAVTNGVVTHC